MIYISAKPTTETGSIMVAIARPETLTVNAEALPLLVSDFMEAKSRQISETSIINYRQDLAPFLAWFEQRDSVLLDESAFQDMTEWIRLHYRNGFGQPATSQTIWRTTKRVRQLLAWAHAKGYIPISITDLCPLYPDPGREKYFPDLDDLAAMIDACAGEWRLRDAALIMFAVATGARRFEIAAVDVTDVTFDTPITDLDTASVHTGFVHLRTVKRDNRGKMRPRYSMFDGSTGLLLKAYIRTYAPTGSLFGLTDSGVQLMVRRVAKVAGLPRMHPHAFRAALIDYWREENATAGPMADVALKLQVGHALNTSADVTLTYQNFADSRRNRERIRTHYRAPTQCLTIPWEQYPVHCGLTDSQR